MSNVLEPRLGRHGERQQLVWVFLRRSRLRAAGSDLRQARLQGVAVPGLLPHARSDRRGMPRGVGVKQPEMRPSISYHWQPQPVILVSHDGRSTRSRSRLFQPGPRGISGAGSPVRSTTTSSSWKTASGNSGHHDRRAQWTALRRADTSFTVILRRPTQFRTTHLKRRAVEEPAFRMTIHPVDVSRVRAWPQLDGT